jgi:MGT family glycosyltransferase
MARFLFTPWPLRGHTNPTLAIAHALRERGHQAAFYTGASAQPTIEAEGFRCFPFQRIAEETVHAAEHPDAYARSILDQLRAIRKIQRGLREWLVDTVPGQVEDLREAMTDWPPDVLVAETAMWGPILVLSEITSTPVAVFSTFAACLLPGPQSPAWGLGLPRPRTAPARWRSRAQRRLMWWMSADFRAAANRVRARYRLAPIDVTVTEHAGRMPLYLMPSVPEFDYDRTDLPGTVHYVGPCSWDKPIMEPSAEWIAGLSDDRPVVHVTEATIHTHEPLLLKAAARGFAGEPIEVVMTTGEHRSLDELDLGPLAPNIRVEAYVPHSDLMRKTSVVVCLGGAGTVFAALKAGVPLVVVPTEWDKPENAQRVVEAGAGLRIEPRQLTAERLRAAVREVLSTSSYRDNARRLAAACGRYGGAHDAARLLAGLVPLQPSSPSAGHRG